MGREQAACGGCRRQRAGTRCPHSTVLSPTATGTHQHDGFQQHLADVGLFLPLLVRRQVLQVHGQPWGRGSLSGVWGRQPPSPQPTSRSEPRSLSISSSGNSSGPARGRSRKGRMSTSSPSSHSWCSRNRQGLWGQQPAQGTQPSPQQLSPQRLSPQRDRGKIRGRKELGGQDTAQQGKGSVKTKQ